ncbi:protein kinase, partial [Planctomycetota bacterium]
MNPSGMHSLQVGSVIAEKYRIIRELGQGAFGAVFEIEHQHVPGQRLAIKVLHPHLARDENVRARFIREVQVALRLVHENIVIIRDCLAMEALTYYTMDYVEGTPLDVVLEQGEEIAVARALDWCRQTLLGLSVAHKEGIVHRDIKPANLMLTERRGQDVIKVIDFGIAKVLEATASLTMAETIVGTPQYLSPEQCQGKPSIDGRADIYSVGVVLYELLAGQLPFQSESLTGLMYKHAFESPPLLSIAAPERNIPAAAGAIALKAMAKDPAERYQDTEEMAAAIDAFLRPATAPPEAAPGTLWPSPNGALTPGAATLVQSGAQVAQAGVDWNERLEGQRVEKYVIRSILGKGGFGVVCEAEHTMIGRKVALKLLRPELGTEQGFLDRFRREARVAANMEHPALVTIYDYGEVPGACFIAMEFVIGDTLHKLLARRGALSPGEVYGLLTPILQALAVAHEQNVVHRDLKPPNIMITDNNQVKVLDFGIAKIVGGDGPALTQAGAIIGTADYIAPEQILGQPVDTRADLYSLGCIVFEMLTGRTPFVCDSAMNYFHAHVQEPPPRLCDAYPQGSFSLELESTVARLLAKEPEERFQTVDELASALDAMGQRGGASASPSALCLPGSPTVPGAAVSASYAPFPPAPGAQAGYPATPGTPSSPPYGAPA